METKWLEWAKQLQAIAQAGLTYSKDDFDLERFELIRKISVDILAHYTEMDFNVIRDLFTNETGYATPKVDIRAVIFQNDQILLVQEKNDGKWALPGGWADIGLSPSEVAVKEVKEESGYDVKAIRLLAVTDYKKHPHPPSPYHIYKLFILCEIVGGEASIGLETIGVQFFAEKNLPPLSTARNTISQIEKMFCYLKNPDEKVYLD